MNGVSGFKTGALELVLDAHSDRFDSADDRWRAQVNDFYFDLGRRVDGLRREVTPEAGTKGGAEAIILALGSAGTLTAAVEVFRAWLGRDRTRRLDITFTRQGEARRVTVRGDAVSDEALAAVATAASEHLGEVPWDTPATKPC